ncbi:hypothetical protein K4K49_003930 [Colletotrichum sp. SAR 10_70]|nr:hypothetical protein K4K50_004703 [Colletotrichum sp. SAR 10_71]KAI8182576.1 hypothetical protein K4K51_000849 [Colletotrichum sp. SAR 10_75]KAI8198814.1 hypothetical protein K4K49_003930 [Colletotrichum sp. SAR 10_70]KAI8213799.1 hypothetical protein K4K52_003803 [Colletotrichum sp. SAR 10_76]KAI8234740.1 hypothetical protein K4K54_007814 [Colletotrichum sp. SAR 10_86]KAJ4999508.1 hypothetical protein K4K48_004034 [Colletotrichum sp. SAR 10_66]
MTRRSKEARRRGKRWQRGVLHVKKNWTSSPMACRIIERLRSHDSADFAPTRLVNVSSWDVIEPAGTPTEYMALSYVWTQHPDREGLRRTVQEAMRHTGVGHVCIDALCVKQDDPSDLAREIPKMGLYYEKAAGVLAVVPELQTAMMQLADPLGGGPEGWIEGPEGDEYKLTSWLEARYRQLGKQLKISKWIQRVWTFQEAVLNEQTIAWNGWGFCSMEDLAVAQIVEALGGRARSVTRLVKKVWAVNTEGGSSAEATTWNPFLRHTMSPKVKLADMPTLWNNNKERQCGREEDLVYGYMGLVSDLPENITVDYGLGFAGVYGRLMRGRSVNLTVMCSSPNAASGKCWMPRVKGNRFEIEADGHPSIESSGLVGNGGLLQVKGFMATLFFTSPSKFFRHI